MKAQMWLVIIFGMIASILIPGLDLRRTPSDIFYPAWNVSLLNHLFSLEENVGIT